MDQWLRVSTAPAEDASLVFSVPVRLTTTACNSSSRGSKSLVSTDTQFSYLANGNVIFSMVLLVRVNKKNMLL